MASSNCATPLGGGGALAGKGARIITDFLPVLLVLVVLLLSECGPLLFGWLEALLSFFPLDEAVEDMGEPEAALTFCDGLSSLLWLPFCSGVASAPSVVADPEPDSAGVTLALDVVFLAEAAPSGPASSEGAGDSSGEYF